MSNPCCVEVQDICHDISVEVIITYIYGDDNGDEAKDG